MAALPGIVGRSIGLPDVHSGYGFAIGNVAAFDMADPEAVVSPGMFFLGGGKGGWGVFGGWVGGWVIGWTLCLVALALD